MHVELELPGGPQEEPKLKDHTRVYLAKDAKDQISRRMRDGILGPGAGAAQPLDGSTTRRLRTLKKP